MIKTRTYLVWLAVLAACSWLCGMGMPPRVGSEAEHAAAGDRLVLELAPPVALPTAPPPAADEQTGADNEAPLPKIPRSHLRAVQKALGRRSRDNSVKAAFGPVTAKAADATVSIIVRGKKVALGAIVDSQGYVVTKASLLDGKTICRLRDGRELAATLVGVQEKHDLALLNVHQTKLTPVSWRPGEAPPAGSWIATVGPGGKPLAVGIVSAAPRRIDPLGCRHPDDSFLGITLDEADPGPRITHVYEDSAAEAAGLKVDDLVTHVDGIRIRTTQQLIVSIGGHPPGKTIVLSLRRGEEDLQIPAALGKAETNHRCESPADAWGGGPFSKRRGGFPMAMPHDMVVRPNQCGGPIVDTDGNTVGINIARALRVTSYAIPADVVRRVVAELKQAHLARAGR